MKILVLGSFSKSLINFRGVFLNSLVKNGHEVIACAPDPDPEVLKKLKNMGVVFQTIPLQRTGRNPLQDLKSIFTLTSLFRKTAPDLIFNYTIKPVLYGSLAARFAGVPRCHSVISGLGTSFMRSSIEYKLINFLVRILYRVCLSKNDGIFFQNPDDIEMFRKLNLLPKHCAVTLINGSGVDLEYYSLAPLPDNPPVFLLIARLLKEKGIVEYAEAARIIKNKHPEITFRLVGWFDDHPSAIARSTIETLQEEGILEYCGSAEDVRPFIGECNVYVLPSYREGTPRTVLEAMAMGRPIITSDAPGCRETVVEGKNGFLVPPRNPKKLAEAMLRFVDNPEIIDHMGKYSHNIAKNKYDVHQVNRVLFQAMGLLPANE